MNPKDRGWLKRFLSFRQHTWEQEPQSWRSHFPAEESAEHLLYRAVQPTGLPYGHALTLIGPAPSRMAHWGAVERTRVLLTDGLLHASLYYQFSDAVPTEEAIQESVRDISSFARLFFQTGKKHKPVSLSRLEYLLDNRTRAHGSLQQFWYGFFTNSLLFLDLIQFLRWKNGELPGESEALESERRMLRLQLLHLIAAASYADGELSHEEEEFFKFFLVSAGLSKADQKEALEMLHDGVDPADLNPQLPASWGLRKYFMEIAILVCYASHTMVPEERAFIHQLAKKLNMDPEEVESSFAAIESFVLANWEEVHFLNRKHTVQVVGEHYVKNLRRVLRKNQHSLQQELAESRELVVLLRKAAHEDLTLEERKKVKAQLLDLLRAIPALTIFLMPGGFITLPILLSILPKNVLLPSSFQD